MSINNVATECAENRFLEQEEFDVSLALKKYTLSFAHQHCQMCSPEHGQKAV